AVNYFLQRKGESLGSRGTLSTTGRGRAIKCFILQGTNHRGHFCRKRPVTLHPQTPNAMLAVPCGKRGGQFCREPVPARPRHATTGSRRRLHATAARRQARRPVVRVIGPGEARTLVAGKEVRYKRPEQQGSDPLASGGRTRFVPDAPT